MDDSLKEMGIGPLVLCGGHVLEDANVAYLTLGTLNAAGDNAVLVTHGFTSGPSMLLRTDLGTIEGSWADLVGPGAAIDTDRYFVVCPNMLGLCYGSTGPASIDPRTQRPFGPAFPEFSIGDMVASQYALLVRLGVTRLRAVVGPSYGGIQALQWALDHPDMVDAIGVIVSGPRFPQQISPGALLSKFAAAPSWNGGWIYGGAGIAPTLAALRTETLQSYGTVQVLRDRGCSDAECAQAISALAADWARSFDPNALVALAGAGQRFDARDALTSIRARMLWVNSTSDAVFPPDPAVQHRIAANRVSPKASYHLLESRYGHVASGADWRKWAHLLAELVH